MAGGRVVSGETCEEEKTKKKKKKVEIMEMEEGEKKGRRVRLGKR